MMPEIGIDSPENQTSLLTIFSMHTISKMKQQSNQNRILFGLKTIMWFFFQKIRGNNPPMKTGWLLVSLSE